MTGKIIAIGGLSPAHNDDALHRFVVASAGKAWPRVCYVPAASGDFERYTGFFYEQYPASVCDASHLSLFRDVTKDPVGLIAGSDVIYVGGGSTPILLGALRAFGLDDALRHAWEGGAVLAGDSAGALICFEGCITTAFGSGPAVLADGLGFLPGSLAAHFDPAKADLLTAAVEAGTLAAPGWGVDAGAALVFEGTDLAEVVSSRPTGGAWHLDTRARQARLLGARRLPGTKR
jgi:dipeptidase E